MVLQEGGDYQKMIADFDAAQEAQAIVSETASKPNWMHRHPYLASSIAIAGLLFLGAALFLRSSDVTPAAASGAWGGAGGLFFENLRARAPYRPSTSDATGVLPTAPIILPFIPHPAQDTGGEDPSTDEPDDLAALLSLLVATRNPDTSTSSETPHGYEFIPQGLITVEKENESRAVIPGQESSLHEYGNQIGAYIQDFESAHAGAPQILKDHIEDRANPAKIAALERVALDMQEHGRSLIEMDYVPTAAAGMHKAYANAYRAIGFALQDVAHTNTDEEFVAAVGVYNSSVEELTRRFLMLVALFGANNVSFSSSEPGSVFMFNANMNTSL